MIERRPTLPTGYALPGLPAVAKALHSDSTCELYSLLSSDAGQTTLLLLWSPDMSPHTRRVSDWLNAQHPLVLSILRVLTAEECPENATGFMLELRGRRIDDENLKAAEGDRIRRLLHSMLDLVERGQSIRMYPDFNPSLSWQLGDEGILCTLLPLNEQTLSELDQVRLVA